MDKQKLLAARLGQAAVELGDELGAVRVRALSRAEIFELKREFHLGESDADGNDLADMAGFETAFLSLALVDPQLSREEVELWRKNSPAGEIEPVSQKVNELSDRASGKENYKSVRR